MSRGRALVERSGGGVWRVVQDWRAVQDLRRRRLLGVGVVSGRVCVCAGIPPFAADNDEESFILTLRGNYDK